MPVSPGQAAQDAQRRRQAHDHAGHRRAGPADERDGASQRQALPAGPGFLLKDTQPAHLVAAIRTIAAGNAVLAPGATSRLVRQFATTQPPEPSSSHRAAQIQQALTSREQDVFSHIAAGQSDSEIAASLFLSEGTVKIHVGRILAKLGLRDRVQAVVLAYESRLITPGTPPPPSPDRRHM